MQRQVMSRVVMMSRCDSDHQPERRDTEHSLLEYRNAYGQHPSIVIAGPRIASENYQGLIEFQTDFASWIRSV